MKKRHKNAPVNLLESSSKAQIVGFLNVFPPQLKFFPSLVLPTNFLYSFFTRPQNLSLLCFPFQLPIPALTHSTSSFSYKLLPVVLALTYSASSFSYKLLPIAPNSAKMSPPSTTTMASWQSLSHVPTCSLPAKSSPTPEKSNAQLSRVAYKRGLHYGF